MVWTERPNGKIRWTIELEESDGRSNTILGKHPRVLLVFGNSLLALHSITLEQAGCVVDCASDGEAAMKLHAERGPYDVVLTGLPHFRRLSERMSVVTEM